MLLVVVAVAVDVVFFLSSFHPLPRRAAAMEFRSRFQFVTATFVTAMLSNGSDLVGRIAKRESEKEEEVPRKNRAWKEEETLVGRGRWERVEGRSRERGEREGKRERKGKKGG